MAPHSATRFVHPSLVPAAPALQSPRPVGSRLTDWSKQHLGPLPPVQGDGGICMRIPHVGFERECFKEGALFEECLQKPGNFGIELLRTCSRTEPCRDDYAPSIYS